MIYHVSCASVGDQIVQVAINHMGNCDKCGAQIIPEDHYVQAFAKSKAWDDLLGAPKDLLDTPFVPKAVAPKVDLQELGVQILPDVLKAVKGVLPNIVQDKLPGILTNEVRLALVQCAKDLIRDAGAPQIIQIKDLPPIDVSKEHKAFPKLLKALIAGVNVWLAGPSGSGKTTAAMHVAKGLGCQFRYIGAVSDSYALMGFRDAMGQVVKTPFREAWEHGGVFLWDEVDASDPNALLAFNAALANGSCAFPDAVITKHPNLHVIAAANTWGHGATNEYVGRNKIDAAFLKRFAFISWEYDEDLEKATCNNKEWVDIVQKVRHNVKDKGIRVLVTPRETYIGERLLAAGLSLDEVQDMTIRSGMTAEQWDKVRALPDLQRKTDWEEIKQAPAKPVFRKLGK